MGRYGRVGGSVRVAALAFRGYNLVTIDMTEIPLIICFGDSLTAGYQSPSPVNPSGRATPYGHMLEKLISPRARVAISGMCGELTGEMVMRFRSDVLVQHPRYVVILGGTNDLGCEASPHEIMRNLLKMYETARADGIIPIPVTVPSIRMPDAGGAEAMSWLRHHIAGRQVLNGLILEYAGLKELRSLNLFDATCDPHSLQLAARFSNDGLHLTTEGYRLCAMLLYEQIFRPALDH
jgi:lysophospholipase L1-like esterase